MKRKTYFNNVRNHFITLIALIVFSLLFHNLSQPYLQVHAQTCNAPATATGVEVSYPGCQGEEAGAQCSLENAKCKWNSQADAASYNVTITEVESGNVIKNNESVQSSSNNVLFPVTQGKTYKCDVVAVSSCGGLALAATDQLLCEADAIIATPTATLIPTVAPTTPIIPPKVIQQPGGILQTVAITGGVLLAIVGGIIFFVI